MQKVALRPASLCLGHCSQRTVASGSFGQGICTSYTGEFPAVLWFRLLRLLYGGVALCHKVVGHQESLPFWMAHSPPPWASLWSLPPCCSLPTEGSLGLSGNFGRHSFLWPGWSCRFCREANSRAVNSLSPPSTSFKSPAELGHRAVGWFFLGLCGAATLRVHCLRNTELVSKLNSFQ